MASRRFCKHCGAPLEEGDLFCPECNAPYENPSDKKEESTGNQTESSEHGQDEVSDHDSSTNGGESSGRKMLVPILVTIGAVLIAGLSSWLAIKGQSNYEVVIKDCTWQQAFEESIASGGHLIMIETEKEYEKLVSLLSEAELGSVRLYISAARDNNGDKYYWVDKKLYMVGEALNGDKSYAKDVWKSGNPSMVNSQDTSIVENRVELQHTTSFQWAYNDVADNILDADPDWAGRIGYIIEYD